jgi:hypothetical protein
MTTLVSNVTVGASITKVTNDYIATMITKSIIHFPATMFTFYQSYKCSYVYQGYHCCG